MTIDQTEARAERRAQDWEQVERAFFAAGDALADAPAPAPESFDDLT